MIIKTCPCCSSRKFKYNLQTKEAQCKKCGYLWKKRIEVENGTL